MRRRKDNAATERYATVQLLNGRPPLSGGAAVLCSSLDGVTMVLEKAHMVGSKGHGGKRLAGGTIHLCSDLARVPRPQE